MVEQEGLQAIEGRIEVLLVLLGMPKEAPPTQLQADGVGQRNLRYERGARKKQASCSIPSRAHVLTGGGSKKVYTCTLAYIFSYILIR
jgi:hypothetical protein